MALIRKEKSDRKDEFQLTRKSLSKDVEAELSEDDYDSELSFSRRWDKAEQEMLSGDTLTQDEFFQRIRTRVKQ